MSTDIIKYAFIAGELSPTLFGRTDLTKFDLGMSEARNFFVDYRGGLSSRPGTQFQEFIAKDDKPSRLISFAFSPEEEDTNVLIFGDFYMRVTQTGNYILEDEISCTTSAGTPLVVSATAHGLTDGRWIKSAGISYEVSNASTNTFELLTVPHGAPVDGSKISLTTFAAVYEIETPYAGEDLIDLFFDQYRDRVRVTGNAYEIRDITRIGQTNWVISIAEISEVLVGPNITGESLSDSGTAQAIFAVTKVTENGTESIEGFPYRLDNSVNYPVEEGSVSIAWAPQTDAAFYNVYRSVVAGGTTAQTLSMGSELGYLGQTQGTKFTDPNIVPDFGVKPPRNYNPFAGGAITRVAITSNGTGYTSAPLVSFTGGGSGALARAVVNDSGNLVNIILLSGGEGYVNPTVALSGPGSGAVAEAFARPLEGTYPALSTIYQQRQVFAASLEAPITIWGSQLRRFNNFNSSDLVLATDSYEFDLDTPAINPIRHLLATRGGLIAMTQDNVWLVRGATDQAITPTSVLAEPQTYTGVSNLDPIRINSSILYTEGKGYAVRTLEYNEFSRVYSGVDRSILSSHLFGEGKEILAWAFQESPYKVVWCIRADGALLAYTTVQEEEVFAWTPCETQGRFVDVIKVRENNNDRIYLAIERFIAGRWTRFFERLDLRQFKHAEEAWCVDSGLALDKTFPAGTVTLFKSETGEYTASIVGGNWDSAIGKMLRAAEGLFEVMEVEGAVATLRVRRHATAWVPETEEAYSFPLLQGMWSLDTPVSNISGLHHLEGETVSILADGNVIPRQQVVNGSITLPAPATSVVVGLRFTCRARTLPLIVPDAGIESKRKRVVAVSVRLQNSRALKAGDTYETVYEFPERTNENWGEPIALQNDQKRMPIGTTWDEDSFTYFLLDDPLPVTLLSLVQEIEVGDEDD